MNAPFSKTGNRVINLNPYPTYNLIHGPGNISRFYSDLDTVTREVTETGLNHFSNELSEFGKWNSSKNGNQAKTEKEYLLEVLMLGTLWNKYQGRWRWYNSLVNPLFRQLIYLRKTFLKRTADKIRGKLNSLLLDKPTKKEIPFDHDNFYKLIVWLSSTGEYPFENQFFSRWLDFLYSGIKSNSYEFLAKAAAYGEWFEEYTQKYLGVYTDRVQPFLLTQPIKYKRREDLFFTGASQVEYHLNMVGGEILNKELRPAFLETKRKVLLLPTCMVSNASCKAEAFNNGMVCQKCSSSCKVSEIASEMQKLGVETILFRHTSDFTKWLKPWKNQADTGLIGTGCVMNLLSGGYALKHLNIPAQCIYLDYSGCSRHWCKKSVPTNINISRLRGMLDVDKGVCDQPEENKEALIVEKESTVA
ncbi:MAG: DUF116 domain-containing protein [Prolixibacteraceae bacterium]|nr:DUF116 domain-containing protein [Prolixibacteraceae bacterium]